MAVDVDPQRLIDKLASGLEQRLARQHRDSPALIGIHSGGVWVAERLHRQLRIAEPLGKLDISFYRDDFSRIGMNPQVRPSDIPFDVDGRHIVLVDDVLYTGRTIRAALDVIFDYGRPDSILLAVLVDRGERELPIQADAIGTALALAGNEQVKLSGPEPLQLVIKKLPNKTRP